MGKLNSYSEAVVTPAAERVSVNWIVGKWTDLFCFIGAALLGYGMFFLHAGLAMNMVTVWFVWYMFIDSPHFFGTYSRTYLDKEEMVNRRRLLLGSILLLLVGPLFVLIGFGLYSVGITWFKKPYLVLVAFVSIWAYWHVVRQHYGIMSLYKRKNGDGEMLDRRLDQWIIYLGLFAPFVAFAVTNNGARVALGMSTLDPDHAEDLAVVGTPYQVGEGWEWLVVQGTLVLAASALLLLVARQIVLWQRGGKLNVPKILFLLAVIPLHMLVCYHPSSTTLHVLGFSACVTIFHDVQYHAIVWYYQKNRMEKAGDEAKAKYGLAAKIGKSFPIYVMCAVGMGLTLGLLGCVIEVNPGCFPNWVPMVGSKSMDLYGSDATGYMTMNELFYGVFLGVLMHHYFVDQFIWRPSKDKNVQEDLKLEKQSA